MRRCHSAKRPGHWAHLEPLEHRILLAGGPNQDPELILGDVAAFVEGEPPKRVVPNASVIDDNGHFDGGQLLITTDETVFHAPERFAIEVEGNGPGQVNSVANVVLYEGQPIGTFTGASGYISRPFTYKQVREGQLKLYVVEAVGPRVNRPALVLFENSHNLSQFDEQAKYLASRGMVVVLVDYRHMVALERAPPDRSIADVKSSLRWVRAHVDALGIDPQRIAIGGGSFGGSLAAIAAMVDGKDDPKDDLSISAKPNAQVLFNAPVDFRAGHWGDNFFGERYAEYSPLANVSPDDPPMLYFIGDADHIIPLSEPRTLAGLLQEQGTRADLLIYPGEGHGFFNYGLGTNPDYYDTLRKVDEFFASLGWLEGDATLVVPSPLVPQNNEIAVTFNENATPEAVTALLRRITFYHDGDVPSALRNFHFSITDGQEGASDTLTRSVRVTATNDPPVLAIALTPTTYKALGPMVSVVSGTTSDPDSPNFDRGTLRFRIRSGLDAANDEIIIRPTGSGPIGIAGQHVTYAGLVVGSWSGGTNGQDLRVLLNHRADVEVVRNIMLRTGFHTKGDNPSTTPRVVGIVMSDGDGAFSRVVTSRINVVVPQAPVISPAVGSTLSYVRGDPAIDLLESATLADPDSPAFTDGYLVVRAAQGSHSSNRLLIGGGFTLEGNEVKMSGQTIGVRNTDGGIGLTRLQIRLSAFATRERVQQLIRGIGFQTSGISPMTQRIFEFTVFDGDRTSNAVNVTVNVN